MSVGIQNFNPDRLTQAREARGLYATSLAEMAGLSNASISKFESGISKPTHETLASLAKSLNVPISYFTKPSKIADTSPVFYRSLASATKQIRARAFRKFEWFGEICDYMESFFDFPQVNLPEIPIPDDFRDIDDDHIEFAAHKFREFAGVKPGPIPNLIRLLEKLGVAICRADVGDLKVDAFSQFRDSGRPFIFLVSDKASAVRSRLDLGHELGHLLLHKNINQKTLNNPKYLKLIEKQAYRFSSALLLPPEDFTKDLIAPSLDCFKSMKLKWKVAVAAMIYRCKTLDIINEDEEKRFWINLNRRGWKKSEPFDDVIKPELPELVPQCIKLLLENNVSSKDQLLENFTLNSNDVEELCSLPDGFFEKDFGSIIAAPRFKQDDKADHGHRAIGSNVISFPNA